jgi:crotonobetainyl-CoA hydratase
MRESFEFCRVERRDRLLTVTMNRPQALNAMHPPMHDELEEIWNDYAADENLWVAILTGAGERAFSAGHDLKFHASGGQVRFARGGTGFAGLTERFDLVKPLIAAVNGLALGGGFETALACDLVVADESARFALPEPRVGLAALAGGLHRLPRQIGLKRAMGMILTGRQVSANEGMALGFVNEVVPAGTALAVAERWAAQILECSPMSIRASKQVAIDGLNEADYVTAFRRRHPAVDALLASEDFKEGPRAFAERRAPRWAGR